MRTIEIVCYQLKKVASKVILHHPGSFTGFIPTWAKSCVAVFALVAFSAGDPVLRWLLCDVSASGFQPGSTSLRAAAPRRPSTHCTVN